MTDTIRTLIEQVTKLKNRNDWQGIYQIFQPITDLPKKDLIWSNPKVLNEIGYACAKLAETSGIPREIFGDQKAKDKFLEEQAEYRKHAEQIRKRCIELVPNSASYRSDLAYTYYQNINELDAPRGRRDGNLGKEIDKFLEAVDEALKLNPKRVNDLYRKGRILTNVLPGQIEDRSGEDFIAKSKKSNEIRDKGIQTLKRAQTEWENLCPDNSDEQFWRDRWKGCYISTLYTLSKAYHKKISNDWDESVFALNLQDDISTNHPIDINTVDGQSIEYAIDAIKKCCKADCPTNFLQDIRQKQQSFEEIAAYNGKCEGVDKLYSIGKFFFAKYWILSGYGLKETDDAVKAREVAERYLQAALKCKWSPEKAKQEKVYIAERIARVYISKGEYDQAISIIKLNSPKKLEYSRKLEDVQPYILQTWALAMLKSGRTDEAHAILNIAKKKSPTEKPWLTHFLKGCTYLETDEIEHAQKQLELAHQTAERVGKKNVDSLLIAKASVSYKSGKVPEAVKYLEEAQRLNPYRRAISERIRKWQQNDNYSDRLG